MDENKSRWLEYKSDMAGDGVTLGRHTSYWLDHSPRRLLHYLSYYKFAAKMIGHGKTVLDLGCAEGIGTWLLAKECGQATGIDYDTMAIATARKNWLSPNISFQNMDFFQYATNAPFDAVTSFDVIEHIEKDSVKRFWALVRSLLKPNGVFIVGTPSEISQQFSSPITSAGHVNVYSHERLRLELSKTFKNEFIFSANDELVHTGFLPLAHYLIGIGCRPKCF